MANSAYCVDRPAGARRLVAVQAITRLLLVAAVARFWIAPLGSSLWLDETGTFWTIKDGLAQLFLRVREWPSISAVDGLVWWVAYSLGGAHEYVLRIPSVLATAGASLCLYRLANRLLDADSAFPAVVAFICSQTVVFAACDARPYALLLLAVTGSTLALVRWLDSGGLPEAVIYVITATLVPYIHYLAGPVLGVHAVYALLRLRQRGPVPLRRLLAAAAAIAVLLIPLVPVLTRMFHERADHAFSHTPAVPFLAMTLTPPALILAAGAGLLVAYGVCGRLGATPLRLPPPTLALLVTLAFGPVCLLLAISLLTSTQILVPRYGIPSQVALALLAGWGIGRLRPALARSIVIVFILVCSIVAFGALQRLWPVHGHEDWRGAMAAVRQMAGDTQMPVIVQSGFVEASARKMDFAGDLPSYLMAPLSFYRPAGRILPAPYRCDHSARRYLESSVLPLLVRSKRFLLVTRKDGSYPDWLLERLPGYVARRTGDFGAVQVTLFQFGPAGSE